MSEKWKTRFDGEEAGLGSRITAQHSDHREIQRSNQNNLTLATTSVLNGLSVLSEWECLQAVRSINNSPRLSRDARRVGIALACIGSEGRLAVGVEALCTASGQNPARVIAGLMALHNVGLVQRVPGHGFCLVWNAFR